MFQIKNKVVIVTGASQGIGKCLAIELGKRGAIIIIGARSIKNLKKVESIIKYNGGNVFTVVLDITSKSSVKSMVQKVIKKYGGLDILINNAAVALFQTVAESKQEDIKKVFDTNFFGPLFCIQSVLPYMRKRKKGLIVNISSAVSKYSLYHQSIYAASKAALERITESVDIEEHKFGIRTLLIIPDRTKTQIRKHILGSKKLARLPFKLPESDPHEVAKKIVDAIIKEKYVFHTSLRSRTYHIATTIYPKFIGGILKKTHDRHMRDLK